MAGVMHRARPWLGTLVEIRVEGLDDAAARNAVEAAFAQVSVVHRCMSFHRGDSDLSRLHAAPPGTVVRVDPRTRAVLEAALALAEASAGRFDPSVAAQLVEWKLLPRPHSPFTPDPHADWRAIELVGDGSVRLRRPLWLDLGGIAKGYAVDRALEILIAAGASQACVNAGGDLRVAGARAERIRLRHGVDGNCVEALELRDAAVASSAGRPRRRRIRGRWHGPHVRGEDRDPAPTQRSVSVVAPCCMIADALTKLVLADAGTATRRLLARFGAQACVHDPRRGWRVLEAAA